MERQCTDIVAIGLCRSIVGLISDELQALQGGHSVAFACRVTCYGRDAMLTITGTSRTVLLAAAGAAFLVATAHAQIDDSIRGAPSEANHFIETPDGWGTR